MIGQKLGHAIDCSAADKQNIMLSFVSFLSFFFSSFFPFLILRQYTNYKKRNTRLRSQLRPHDRINFTLTYGEKNWVPDHYSVLKTSSAYFTPRGWICFSDDRFSCFVIFISLPRCVSILLMPPCVCVQYMPIFFCLSLEHISPTALVLLLF